MAYTSPYHTYRRSSAAADTCSEVSTAGSLDTDSASDCSYSTDPVWAADAVVVTRTGIELNFERLHSICTEDNVPATISITLHPPSFPMNGNGSLGESLSMGVSSAMTCTAVL